MLAEELEPIEEAELPPASDPIEELLEGSVASLRARLEGIDDLDLLTTALEVEERVTGRMAIQERINAMSEPEPEPVVVEEPEVWPPPISAGGWRINAKGGWELIR